MTSCLFSSQFCIKHVKLGGQTGEVARSIPVTTTNSLRSLVQTVKFCVAEHTWPRYLFPTPPGKMWTQSPAAPRKLRNAPLAFLTATQMGNTKCHSTIYCFPKSEAFQLRLPQPTFVRYPLSTCSPRLLPKNAICFSNEPHLAADRGSWNAPLLHSPLLSRKLLCNARQYEITLRGAYSPHGRLNRCSKKKFVQMQ